jgi:hypothetical protein
MAPWMKPGNVSSCNSLSSVRNLSGLGDGQQRGSIPNNKGELDKPAFAEYLRFY